MTNSGPSPSEMWMRIVGVFNDKSLGAKQRDNAYFAVAEYVRRNKDVFRKRKLPQRPAMLGSDDEILAEKAKRKHTAEASRLLGMFAVWKAAVTRREAVNAGTLGIILNSMRHFTRLGIHGSAIELRTFAESEFGWTGGILTELGDIRLMSYRATMDRNLLSDDLRRGERTREAPKSHGLTDDISFMEQLDL